MHLALSAHGGMEMNEVLRQRHTRTTYLNNTREHVSHDEHPPQA